MLHQLKKTPNHSPKMIDQMSTTRPKFMSNSPQNWKSSQTIIKSIHPKSAKQVYNSPFQKTQKPQQNLGLFLDHFRPSSAKRQEGAHRLVQRRRQHRGGAVAGVPGQVLATMDWKKWTKKIRWKKKEAKNEVHWWQKERWKKRRRWWNLDKSGFNESVSMQSHLRVLGSSAWTPETFKADLGVPKRHQESRWSAVPTKIVGWFWRKKRKKSLLNNTWKARKGLCK